MSNIVNIKNKIKNFKKIITVPGDKSLSIRWVLFASLANGTSKAKNLFIKLSESSHLNNFKVSSNLLPLNLSRSIRKKGGVHS